MYSFFVKLSKSEFVKSDTDGVQEIFNTFDEIEDYKKQFEQIEDNRGTETYREYLHSIALTALSLFGVDEHSSQNQSDQSLFDGMNISDQSQYFRGWEDNIDPNQTGYNRENEQ